MPERNYASADYRFGYQGLEKDNEVDGEGNVYTTLFIQYDTRVGRWLSIDPEFKKNSEKTPYIAFSNDPIIFTDKQGAADFYSVNAMWIGTDGKNDNQVYVIASNKLKKEIVASSIQGNDYTVPITSDKSVLLIPSKEVRIQMQESINKTGKDGREDGGHVSDKNGIVAWDEGPSPVYVKPTDGGRDYAKASIIPFKVSGSDTYNESDNYSFEWHVHPDVLVPSPNENENGVQLGSSDQSDADKSYVKGKTNIKNNIVFGERDGYTNYYDGKGSRESIKTKDFMNVGNEKSGKVYEEYSKNKTN